MIIGATRRGIALLEVMAATVILTVAVVGWLTLAGQVRHSLAGAEDREADIRRASSVLAWASAMPAESLDAWRAGRSVAEHRLRTRTLDGNLFEVIVEDTLTGAAVISTTVLSVPSLRSTP